MGPVKQTRSRYEAPIYLANMPTCREWGHYASDCDRIHQGRFLELNRLYISWRKPGAPPTQLSRKLNLAHTQDNDNENESSFQFPSNDVSQKDEQETKSQEQDVDIMSPFNEENVYN